MKRLAGLHLAGNALLLWLGYYWLGLGESRAGALAWSAVVALALLVGACWLYGGAFAYFRAPGAGVRGAFQTALRNLPALAAFAIVLLAIYGLLDQLQDYSGRPAFSIASWLTLKLRKPVKPATVLRVFQCALWLVRWVVVPVLAAPVFAGLASGGWRGAFARRRWRWYWIEAPVLLLAALWLPARLLGWVPHAASFGMEMASFAARAAAAYLLFAAGGLGLALRTSGGKPEVSQRKTVASP
jgi:hypothetical protein